MQAARLDAAAAPQFRAECRRNWRPEVTAVSADLGRVSFVDVRGVGALLSLHRGLPPAHRGVTLRRVQPAVRAMLERLHLHRVFQIET